MKEVRLEIWNQARTKFVGYGQYYRTFAAKPTDTVSIKESFETNPIYESDTIYSAKLITKRTDGTQATEWFSFRTPIILPSTYHSVSFSATGVGFTAKVADKKKNLKQVLIEIYSADGKTLIGKAGSYSTKAKDKAGTLTIKESFEDNKVYRIL